MASKANFDPRSRWGDKLVNDGFCIIPTRIIKRWSAVKGLDTTDLALVANLAAFWWTSNSLPFPSTTTLAKNMGVSKRTVERRIQKLVKMRLISRGKEVQAEDGPLTKQFDLSGLIKRFEAV